MRIMKDAVPDAYVELFAKAIHDDYITMRGQIPYSNWDSRPEDFKELNRAQAVSIFENLFLIGCSFDAGDTSFPTVEEFTPEEILLLAKQEHIRWVEIQNQKGWAYSRVLDENKMLHPLLVEWEELPPEVQQKDIYMAKKIIPLLEKAGLRVYRVMQTRSSLESPKRTL